MTDGKSLFQCVSVAPAHEPGATALLEDCLSLQLIVLSLAELDAGAMRIVQPAIGGTELEPVTACQ